MINTGRDNPIVSVIVPVYNVEAYLTRCIQSLRMQTLENIEIILIDDGSKDCSGDLCDKFAQIDDRIKVIHKENQGQGLARNVGLDIAKGSYVLFIDADDYIESHTCGRLVEVMEEKNADLCCFGYQIEKWNGDLFYRAQLTERCFVGEEIGKHFVLHFFGDDPDELELRGISACMTMFRRKVIEESKIRFRSERLYLSEDTIFCLDFCLHAYKALVLPEYFYHYCQNEDSFSHAYRPNRFALTEVLCQVLSEYARSFGIVEETKKRIRMLVWVSLMECIKQEVRRIGQIKLTEVAEIVRGYCDNELVKDTLWGLKPASFSIKQRVFFVCMRQRRTWAVIALAWMRNRQGL